jgi:hypothetical protein
MKETNDTVFKVIGGIVIATILFFGFQYNSNKRDAEKLKYKKEYAQNIDVQDFFYKNENECVKSLKENFILKNQDYSYEKFCADERDGMEQSSFDLIDKTVERLEDFDLSDYKDDTNFYKP